MIPRFAVIPTTGRECWVEAVSAIVPQVDEVIVIWDGGEPVIPEDIDVKVTFISVRRDTTRLPNLSRWWNEGIAWARRCARTEREVKQWDVAILNDDAIVPPDWFDRVSGTMRQMKVAAAAMSDTVSLPILHTRPGVTGLSERMPGFAFMLAGELGVRADEQFQWWCGDNDIDMQSRLKGGTVIIPGRVQHLYPDQSTVGELAARTAIDMQLFVDKWGHRPW